MGDAPKVSAIIAILDVICLIATITTHVIIKKKHYIIKKDSH